MAHSVAIAHVPIGRRLEPRAAKSLRFAWYRRSMGDQSCPHEQKRENLLTPLAWQLGVGRLLST